MRQLLSTLYVTTPETYLALDNENVAIWKGDTCVGKVPLNALESIEYFGHKGVSPALIGACSDKGIGLNFYKQNGAFRARIALREEGRQLARRELYRTADNADRSAAASKGFIAGKLVNSKRVLERARRDHPLSVDGELMAGCTKELSLLIGKLDDPLTIEQLRGVEGAAAKCYFKAFGQLILVEREHFAFEKRSRRPPKDPANAMLSFAYTMLANDCAAALEANGLDPYVGLMHCDRAGRKSLALDLMEELRAPLADRTVVTAINNRIVQPKHFEKRQDGSTYLTEEGRRNFLGLWQKKKAEELTHPYLKEKVPWGLIPHVQAKLFARWLRGDLDAYPPFFWR